MTDSTLEGWDGIYTRDGEHSGKPMYTMEPTLNVFWHEPFGRWVIGALAPPYADEPVFKRLGNSEWPLGEYKGTQVPGSTARVVLPQ